MLNLQERENNNSEKEQLREDLIKAIVSSSVEKSLSTMNVGYYYECVAPKFLYKYMGATDLTIENIKNSKLWYSAPCKFNDTYDCDIYVNKEKIYKSLVKYALDNKAPKLGSQEWKKIRGYLNTLLVKFDKELKSMKENMGIACVSEDFDSELMWAHYAGSSRGVCVEYNLMDVNKDLNFTFIPVIYSDSKVSFDEFCMDDISEYTLNIFIKSITSKASKWSYEKEWRIIRDRKSCGDNWNLDKKGALLPMIKPSSIILGCESSGEFEEEIIRWCTEEKVDLYKMEKAEDSYALAKKEVMKF